MQPENVVTLPQDTKDKGGLESALKEVTKEHEAIEADLTNEVRNIQIPFDAIRKRSIEWDEKYKEKSIEEKQEDARIALGSKVAWTFSISVLIFVLTGCWIAAFSDEAHLKSFISVVQTIGAMLTWAVGFVMGHYFTNKDSR